MPFNSPNGATFEDFEDCVNTLSNKDSNALTEGDAKAICGKWQSQYKEENSMKVVDLTKFKDELDDEELQDFQMGDIVKVPQGVGIIAAMADSPFKYPVGKGDKVKKIKAGKKDVKQEKIDASKDNPVYIVALQDGGSVAVTADQIDGNASLKGDNGTQIKDWKDVGKKAQGAQLASVYDYVEGDINSYEELQAAKVKMIHETQAAALADYIEEKDKSLAELQEMSVEELLNIPGVDDPEVGFAKLPPGWTRKSVLQAWATVGGLWRTCYPRMIPHFGSYMAKRWCAALKDEVLGTEMWRNKF